MELYGSQWEARVATASQMSLCPPEHEQRIGRHGAAGDSTRFQWVCIWHDGCYL